MLTQHGPLSTRMSALRRSKLRLARTRAAAVCRFSSSTASLPSAEPTRLRTSSKPSTLRLKAVALECRLADACDQVPLPLGLAFGVALR